MPMSSSFSDLRARVLVPLGAAAALLIPATPLTSQSTRLEARPAELRLVLGAEARVEVVALAADGSIVSGAPIRVVGPRRALSWEDGAVTALSVGDHELIATLATPGMADPLTLRVPVRVVWPEIARVELAETDPDRSDYVGTRRLLEARAYHADGSERPTPEVRWRSEDPEVLRVDRFGQVVAVAPGAARIVASVEGVDAGLRLPVRAFPSGPLTLRATPRTEPPLRTGDVLPFSVEGPAQDLPLEWSVERIDGDFRDAGSGAGAQLIDGRFLADVAGVYRVSVASGALRATETVEVVPRDVVEELEVVGHGLTEWYRTTDLWVWEGLDGRDYAITGSKVSGGHAFIFDVTDPASIVKVDSVQADARTINDVKVSPDGRYAVMSREGASTRRNGVVILDVANPRDPQVASVYEEGLTGGVHNVFATDTHLFALSAGDKYVILDVTDIYAPRYVSEYNHPDSRIHDVWVHDGLAYSSEWGTGLVVVDVGNGRWGGTIEEPVLVTTFPLPTGATHAAFPWYSESAEKMYVFVGDEVMNRRGKAWAGYPREMGSYADRYDPETGLGGIPLTTSGYIQIVDFTDPENPEMVGRYEVPEYGTHNFWIEDDRLYQAYYEGGVRVVDVSGELLGNLYHQGREIAVFKSAHPEGYTANATMVWGAQPFKGHLFFSDTNSGLWAVRLVPKERPIS